MEDDRLSYENLYRLYVTEKLRILDVARAIGARNDVVLAKLHEYGLVKPRGITREWLEDEYVVKQRDIDELAAELGLDESSLRYHLRKYGISIRYKSRGSVRNPLLHDREWLEREHITNQKSLRQIADEQRVSVSSLVLALSRMNFKARKPRQRNGERKLHNYRHQFTPQQRARILQRDGHMCRFPGCERRSQRLEIHHILPRHRGGTNDTSNGITLCRACHWKTYGKEHEYEQIFLSLVTEPST